MALGLKKETADMCICRNVELAFPCPNDEYIPAWSLHRLFQIYTNKVPYSSWNMALFDWDDLIDCIEDDIAKGYFNKEYLVDKDTIEEHCKGVLEYLDYIREED